MGVSLALLCRFLLCLGAVVFDSIGLIATESKFSQQGCEAKCRSESQNCSHQVGVVVQVELSLFASSVHSLFNVTSLKMLHLMLCLNTVQWLLCVGVDS